MAAGVAASMEADLVEASTAEAADSTAADIAEAGVELAGAVVMAAMAGAAGVIRAGDAAGVGVIPAGVGVGELASALVGAGVPIGGLTRMRTAIPILITPIIRIIRTLGRPRLRQRTQIGIAVTTEIGGTTRSSKILRIRGQRDRLA